MARIKIQPTVGTLQIQQYDLHVFSRQSDPNSAGNFNTGVLLEELPKRIEAEFAFTLADHPYVQHYYEIESGVDTDIEFDFSDGSMRLRHVRGELQRLLGNIISRSKATGRPALILASAMNRIGRSNATATFLQIVAQQVRTDVLVWTLQDRGLLNPLTQIGEITTILQMAIAGRQESGTKAHTVRGAQEKAVRSFPNRALMERPAGYRRYPCDKMGNALDRDEHGNRTAFEPELFDHWRFEPHETDKAIPQRAFALLQAGYNLGQIAAALNAEFGPHPFGCLLGAKGQRKGGKYTARPWTRQAVKWMLRNPIYIGCRAWGRSEARTVGSSKRIKLERSDWTFSDPDESLRLVDDNTFHVAQGMLDQIEEQSSRRKKAGRPLNINLFFHQSPFLRCAICGGRLSVVKKDVAGAPGGVRYHYVCYSNRTGGAPQCQSHDALAIDAAVRDELAQAFAAVKNYIGPLKEDIEKAGVDKEARRLQRRLAAEETTLNIQQANFLNLPGDTPQFMRDSLYQQVLRQAGIVEELRRDLLRFGESEVAKRQREMLIMLQGMEAFARLPFAAQRDLMHRLLTAVWIWPDGRFVIQRGSQTEEDVERLANAGFDPQEAAFPDLEYRRLRIADQWDSINFVQIIEHTLAMVDQGELPSEVFRLAGMAAKPINRLYRDRDVTGFGPQTSLKMYMIAKREYLDVVRLRADITAWLRKQTETQALTTLARSIDIAPATVAKMLRGESIRRPTYFKFVENVGWSLDAYRALPEGIEEMPKLREMVYWVVCAGSPSLFRRITGERGLHYEEDAELHEGGSDPESVNKGTRARSRGTG
jgi:Recombinase